MILKKNCLCQKKHFTQLQTGTQCAKTKILQLRLDTTFVNDIYRETVKHCKENNEVVPKVRKRKISTRIDSTANNQYFADPKGE